jgi:hypothetical protein
MLRKEKYHYFKNPVLHGKKMTEYIKYFEKEHCIVPQ